MDIRPVNSVGAIAPVTNPTTPAGNELAAREVVTAVREINKSELLKQGQHMKLTRDPQTRQPVIQLVDQDTGEVVDQFPSETVLRLAEQLK